MTDRVGEELGKYRLTRLLGRGSFAEVYLGEQVYLKSEAAVKVLRTQLADSDIESFLKEAQTIARLVHPNIIRIFDFDVHEGTPFLVMDYASHGTLRQRHPKGIAIPLRTVVHYVRQIGDALQYAHNLKFIHRDVKPENMLLGRRDEVLLSDFGIVQVVISTLSENEGTQKIEGTIAYMAPEQFRGKARYATDQYALGVIVYEWLSGNRPFQGSLSEMASQHMFVPPPPLREKAPTIPPAVEEVVMMALAKDPKERFANVQAFANAFEQAASFAAKSSYAGTSPYAPPAPIVFTAPPTPASVNESSQVQQQIPPLHPTVIASSDDRPWLVQQQPPAIPSSSASSGAGMPVFTDPPAQIPLQLPTSADLLPVTETASASSLPTPSGSTPPPFPVQQDTSAPAYSAIPPGHRYSRRTVLIGLVGLAGLTAAGTAGLALSQGGLSLFQGPKVSTPSPPSLGTTLYTYRGHSNLVNMVAWSPDGKHIASSSLDGTVQVWDAANGGQGYTYRGHSSGVTGAAWSPDGKHIASSSLDGTVQVWDAADGGQVYTYRGHTSGVTGAAWSPDGKRIASSTLDCTVQVWDAADGGQVYTYRRHSRGVTAVAWSPDGKRIASGSKDTTVQIWVAS